MSEEFKLPELFQPCASCRPIREALEALHRHHNEDPDLQEAYLRFVPDPGRNLISRDLDPGELGFRCKHCEGRGRVLTPAGKQLIEAMRYAGMLESNGGAHDRID